MKITIELLAQLRDAAGGARHVLECEPPVTAAAIVRRLAAEHGERFAGLALGDGDALASSLLIAVDGAQVTDAERRELADGDVVVLATPIAGG